MKIKAVQLHPQKKDGLFVLGEDGVTYEVELYKTPNGGLVLSATRENEKRSDSPTETKRPMKGYVYVLRVTKTIDDGESVSQRTEIQTGRVCTYDFRDAVKLSLDTESMPWDEKRAQRELISLQRVD